MRRIALCVLIAGILAPTAPIAAQDAGTFGAAWKEGGTCYEIFVRSFYDSDGDGVGDLNGVIEKLDYINDGDAGSQRDLGAQCIWLMPISPSPSYHGYDVTDYYSINPEYGTEADFRRLVAEAHRRGIAIIIDMVLNHSSSEHPYFKHALLHENSPYRDWYIWLPEHPGVKNEWGGDNWHRNEHRGNYYYGFFWQGMPDLNVENRAVVEETKKIATYWLGEMGVDGFRLDAIRHLVEAENGRIVSNLPGTHTFLREYAAHIRSVKPNAYTVGEVWDSSTVLLRYYPDQLDSHFAFEVADSIISAVRSGDARGILPPVVRLQAEVPDHRWAVFLRNHDQKRTMTEFSGDVARAKVAATLLLTMPGLPFVYYGEELGMTADKPDPRLRTPMHWTQDRAAGFTAGTPWEPLRPDSMTANVAAQDADPNSLLNHHRKLIHLRAANPALATGELIPLTTDNPAVTAYLRKTDEQTVLIVANLGKAAAADVVISDTGELPRGEYFLIPMHGPGDRLGRYSDSGFSTASRLEPLTATIYEVRMGK